MNQKVIFILSIFIISTFAESERIAGGEIAAPGDFKYHVKLEPSIGSFRRLCGGALIRVNWVITVAQCIYNARDVIVRLGVVDRLTGPEGAIFWVQNKSHIIIHEDFSGDPWIGDLTHDIGLIYLEDATEEMLDIEYNNIRLINTISLPPSNNINVENIAGVVTGFGFHEDGDEALQSMKLRHAVMVTLPLPTCKSQNPRITDDNFCTDTTAGRSTCVGDEGGPFVTLINNTAYVLGLAGTTFQDCTAGHPAIFINLVSFYDWIMEIIETPPDGPTVEPPPPDSGNCKCECHCYTCPPIQGTPTQRSTFWDD